MGALHMRAATVAAVLTVAAMGLVLKLFSLDLFGSDAETTGVGPVALARIEFNGNADELADVLGMESADLLMPLRDTLENAVVLPHLYPRAGPLQFGESALGPQDLDSGFQAFGCFQRGQLRAMWRRGSLRDLAERLPPPRFAHGLYFVEG